MMNLLVQPCDPRIPLSILLLSINENVRQQRFEMARKEKEAEIERALEEPERWDGMS